MSDEELKQLFEKKIEWSEDMSVGIKLFDKEHNEIIEGLHKFDDCIEKEDKKCAQDQVGTIKKIISNHYNNEEKQFEKYDYPDKESHIREHVRIKQFVDSFIKDFDNMEIVNIKAKLKIIKTILYDHITKIDMSYKEFFQNKNIE